MPSLSEKQRRLVPCAEMQFCPEAVAVRLAALLEGGGSRDGGTLQELSANELCTLPLLCAAAFSADECSVATREALERLMRILSQHLLTTLKWQPLSAEGEGAISFDKKQETSGAALEGLSRVSAFSEQRLCLLLSGLAASGFRHVPLLHCVGTRLVETLERRVEEIAAKTAADAGEAESLTRPFLLTLSLPAALRSLASLGALDARVFAALFALLRSKANS